MRKFSVTLITAVFLCGGTLSASAQMVSDRTDNGAPIVPGVSPLFGTKAAPPACPFTLHGTLGSGSPSWPSVSGFQTERLNRDGTASTCAVPGSCLVNPIVGARQYDAYTFDNTSGLTSCVTVTLNTITQTNCNLWVVGYLNTYNPTNICTNYVGDTGLSSGTPPAPVSFSVNVPSGASLVLVVQDADPGACVAGEYDLTVGGECLPVELQEFMVE